MDRGDPALFVQHHQLAGIAVGIMVTVLSPGCGVVVQSQRHAFVHLAGEFRQCLPAQSRFKAAQASIKALPTSEVAREAVVMPLRAPEAVSTLTP